MGWSMDKKLVRAEKERAEILRLLRGLRETVDRLLVAGSRLAPPPAP
jgi:hypothetical protein